MNNRRRAFLSAVAAAAVLLLTGLEVPGQEAPFLTATPSRPTGPADVVIRWSVPAGQSCQAGGAWTGAKAAEGTETVVLGPGPHAFTLACTIPGPLQLGEAALCWTAPTQNTDGTPYTDPAGYQLFQDRVSPPLAPLQRILSPSTLCYRSSRLEPGTWYFAVTAVNQGGLSSEKSATASKTVEAIPTSLPWTGQASIDLEVPVPARPRAPVLTIE